MAIASLQYIKLMLNMNPKNKLLNWWSTVKYKVYDPEASDNHGVVQLLAELTSNVFFLITMHAKPGRSAGENPRQGAKHGLSALDRIWKLHISTERPIPKFLNYKIEKSI